MISMRHPSSMPMPLYACCRVMGFSRLPYGQEVSGNELRHHRFTHTNKLWGHLALTHAVIVPNLRI
jgi:hypothetical protein